jgi:hypothetical protein
VIEFLNTIRRRWPVTAERVTFGKRHLPAEALPDESDIGGLKRSHVIALAAVGLVFTAAAVASIPRGKPETAQIQAAESAATQTPETAQTEKSGSTRVPMVVPIFLPSGGGGAQATAAQSPAPAPRTAPAQPSQPTVQRSGFGDTARAAAPTADRSVTSG